MILPNLQDTLQITVTQAGFKRVKPFYSAVYSIAY